MVWSDDDDSNKRKDYKQIYKAHTILADIYFDKYNETGKYEFYKKGEKHCDEIPGCYDEDHDVRRKKKDIENRLLSKDTIVTVPVSCKVAEKERAKPKKPKKKPIKETGMYETEFWEKGIDEYEYEGKIDTNSTSV